MLRSIGEIAASVAEGNRFQAILGATGTGKTATLAWTIEKLQRPALVMVMKWTAIVFVAILWRHGDDERLPEVAAT